MKQMTITVVRIYTTESSNRLEKLVAYLKDEAKIRGVTIFRAISGYGDTKKLRTANLIDLSFDLPLIVEFFDEKKKVNTILEKLSSLIKPEHVIFWDAKINGLI